MSRAVMVVPEFSVTVASPVMSCETSRIARIGLSSVKSRLRLPVSSSRRTKSIETTFKSVVISDMFESPTITCNRRNASESACGSSRVLMIGRDLVVALDTPSHMWSARCDSEYIVPRGVLSTFPAPQINCRVIKNGSRLSICSR